jgi:hypothetical protein
MLSTLTKRSTWLLGLLLAACGGGSDGPQATFAVTDGAQELAAVPWPSDLLRDASGRITLADLPLDDTVVKSQLLTDLSTEQDGFGVATGAYFPVGRYLKTSFGAVMPDDKVGSVDPATLDGNVHLLWLSCADGSMLVQPELPVYTYLRASDHPQRIYARPERGVVLRERCTYAYVVTNKVRTDKGALGPSDDLRAVLSDGAPAARLQKAHDLYAPLRARTLGSFSRDQIASATVFTTHSTTPDYLAARGALAAAAAPVATVKYVFARTKTAADDGTLDDLLGTATMEQPGNDNAGGVAHGNIDYIVQGTYDTVDYLGGATLNSLGVHTTAIGIVERDGASKPKIKGTVTVPFSLVIPSGADLTKLKFAVVQHGLGGQRPSMITVANTLAGKGIASILIDLPFHGARNKDVTDALINKTQVAGADGFGESMADASYSFFDVTGNSAAGVASILPRAIRSAFFQAVSDILQAFRLMKKGDLSALAAREPRLAGLAIDATHELYVGESFGSMIGTIVAAFEPGLDGVVLDVDGGGLIFPLLLNSPVYAPIFGTLLNGSLGTHAGETDDPRDTDWGYNLAQMMLEVGDGLTYAPYVVAQQSWPGAADADHPCNVLQLSAFHDEYVPNPANLAVARALGLQPLTLSDGVAPDLGGWPGAAPASGSLAGNVMGVTAAFVQFPVAVHQMMTSRNGEQAYDLAVPGPTFTKLATPKAIANPIDRINTLVASFADTVLKGQAPTVQ